MNESIRTLEVSLAYEYACSLIETNCAQLNANGAAGVWFDLDDFCELAADRITDASTYLEARGLLERDPTNPNHVSLRDESEAS